MKKKYLILICITGALVVLDQVTKLYVHTHFRLGESVSVISSFFNLTYVRNPGAAFGVLADSHPEFREGFFLALPPVAMLIILFVMRGLHDRDRLQTLAFSLVFGGALGNYIDRLRFRYVIDFLDFYVSTHHWPAFNVADMAIVSGISILLLLTFIQKDSDSSFAANSQETTTRPASEKGL